MSASPWHGRLFRPMGGLALSLVLALAPRTGRGDVSFVEPRLLPAGVHAYLGAFFGVASADFDGDGNLDLAATGYGLVPLLSATVPREYVGVWLGNGDGTFQAPVYVDLGPADAVGVAGLVAADLDDDGKPDLAVTAWRESRILVLLGRGDGTFGSPAGYDAGVQAGSLQVADLDGDGSLDLAVVPAIVDSTATQIAVLPGDGLGGFGAPSLHTVSQFPVDLVLADADGRNGLDILVACNTNDELSVLLNDGHGSFPGAATSYSVRVDARGLWAGDFDGDGTLDVLVAGVNGIYGNTCGGGCLVTVHGNGDGTFTAPPLENVRVTGAWPSRFYVAGSLAPDLNGDGRPDALFLRAEGARALNEVTVMLSQPGGGYALSEWVASPGLPADPTSSVDGMGTHTALTADFDGDGAPDLVVGSMYGTGPGTLSFIPGVPGKPGTFRAPRLVWLSRGWAYTHGLSLGRLDAGTTLDVLAITDALDAVPGNGDGTFGAAFAALARVAGPGEFYNTLRTADLNRDGKLDVLWLATDGVQGGPPARHLLALGNGDGTFGSAQAGSVQALTPESGFLGRNAAIADLDGNGAPDLAVLTVGPGLVHVETWLNDGNSIPTFTPRGVAAVQPEALNLGSVGFAVADLDGDGHPDLVAHRLNAAGGDDLLFFKGNGDGTFAAPSVISSDLRSTVGDIAVADVNEDGRPDLIVALDWTSSLLLLLGHGDGTFGARSDIPSILNSEVRVADLDGDGHLDLVVGATSVEGAPSAPAVHRGDGLGGFGPPHRLAIGTGANGVPFELGDLDGDGRPDVVAGHGTLEPSAGPAFDYLTVLLNDSGPRADLAVTLAPSPGQVHVGEPLEWTITVSNHGPEAASGVAIRDALRLGASYLSATASQGSCVQGGRAVSCQLGSMAPGATATVAVRVNPVAVGTLWNSASASSATVDPATADNGASATATVVAGSADLGLTVADAPDPVTAGQQLTYTFTVTNHGPSAASGVTFTDTLPAGVTLVSATPSSGTSSTCSSGSGTVTCSLHDLAAGAQVRVAIVVTTGAAGSLSNTASISANEDDPVGTNNVASALTTVQAPAQPAPPVEKSGCGCGATGGAEMALAASLLAVARLRRKRSAVRSTSGPALRSRRDPPPSSLE